MESRTKNASRNIFFGIVLKLYQILVPFIIRTIMIYNMGIEYLGLNSLFTSLLSVLNLAELGVGSAMVFSMYKPVVEKDQKTICEMMNLYKQYYRIIGFLILIVGLCICPFVPYLIKADIPKEINIYIVYLMNLSLTVITYWLFAYKNSILQAHQRADVVSKVTLITNTLQYVLQIITICIYKNYYLYLIITIITQIINNLLISSIATKMYPNYKAKGKLPKREIKKINQRVKDLFSSKVGAIILNSADTIVISSFLGLNILAIYQNYFYIVSALHGIMTVILASCTAGIGNSLILETEEKNYNDLNKITFMMTWIYGIICCEMLVLYQTFMKIWVGENLLLGFNIVILLVMYFYIYSQIQILCAYKDAAGMWHSDRLRPLVTGLVNLIINIVLINFIGLFGVVLSTILSLLFIGYPWLLHSVFNEVFKIEKKEFIFNMLKYTIIIIIISLVSLFIFNYYKEVSIIAFIIKGIGVFILFNIIWILIFKKNKNYKFVLNKVKNITKKIRKVNT